MFDNKIKRMLGKNKPSNLFNFNSKKMSNNSKIYRFDNMIGTKQFNTNVKGASVSMQNKWKNMSVNHRNKLRRFLVDSDGNRVPNKFD